MRSVRCSSRCPSARSRPRRGAGGDQGDVRLLSQVQGCATSDRRAADYNHRQAMSEAIPAMGWVMVEKTPGPHINDMWDCGAFNQQKIVVEHKGKNENHVTFAKAMKAIFTELGAFVKEHHCTGLEWNPKGVAIADFKGAAAPMAPPPMAPPPMASARWRAAASSAAALLRRRPLRRRRAAVATAAAATRRRRSSRRSTRVARSLRA